MSDSSGQFPNLPRPPGAAQPPGGGPTLPPAPSQRPFESQPAPFGGSQPTYGGTPFGGAASGQGQYPPQGGIPYPPQFPGQYPGQPPGQFPQGGYQPYQPAGVTRSGKALASFILGLCSIVLFFTFVVPLLAFILGLIGVGAIKRSAGRLTGMRMARAGWILGLLGMLGFGAIVAAGVVSAIHNQKVVLADLHVGDCVILPTATGRTEISSLKRVSCDKPHTGELFYKTTLNPDGNTTYPGDDAALKQAGQVCTADPFKDYVGTAYADSSFDAYIISPDENAWNKAKGPVSCYVADANNLSTTGSVQGSGR
ncbi:MAG TPA: septum formation family protein [Ilumatobacteraceae bacterium]